METRDEKLKDVYLEIVESVKLAFLLGDYSHKEYFKGYLLGILTAMKISGAFNEIQREIFVSEYKNLFADD